MSTEKEIAEFLELDKDNIELVEGLTSCHYQYGEAVGRRKGELTAWTEILRMVMALDKRGEVPASFVSKVADKFLTAVPKAEKPPNVRSSSLRATRMRERATWKVLKRRLKPISEARER
jgi:hypothetical protein